MLSNWAKQQRSILGWSSMWFGKLRNKQNHIISAEEWRGKFFQSRKEPLLSQLKLAGVQESSYVQGCAVIAVLAYLQLHNCTSIILLFLLLHGHWNPCSSASHRELINCNRQPLLLWKCSADALDSYELWTFWPISAMFMNHIMLCIADHGPSILSSSEPVKCCVWIYLPIESQIAYCNIFEGDGLRGLSWSCMFYNDGLDRKE